ncbi:MAG: hypothetical protein RIQ47_1453 [Bacteroidota bacterium]|jgi:hypothetical protein
MKLFNRLFLIVLLLVSFACTKEDQLKGTDKELYDEAKASTIFFWYKFNSSLLPKSAGSGHNFSYLRTRYNVTAASQLDTLGKIKPGAVFPEGSLIVKELYRSSTSLSRYAILKKNSSSSDADANGWVWGYIDADENVAEPAKNKGSACTGCHSQADNIDYMLMNKYFQ